MPLYRYKATDQGGNTSEGELFAADEQQAVAQLQAQGQIPIRVTAGASQFGFKRRRTVKGQAILVFTQELATLLAAGVPLDKSLQIVAELAEDPQVARITERLLEAVRGGAALSQAMEAQAGVFSRFYVSMIRAGEIGGSMGQVLNRLAEYLARAKELRDSVVSALIYPAILLTVSLASVFILMVFVVPHFTQLFDDAGKALPLLTQAVVASAEFLRDYWWALFAGVAALALVLRNRLADPAFRLAWDGWVLRLPLVGDLIRKMETARFSRTLGTLLGNGVSILAAMGIVRETLGNRALERGMDEAIEGLKAGEHLTTPLLETDLLPRMGLQMIKVGEETGRLEDMLMQVADIYDREVRVTIQRMLTLLEPVLIVTLGVVIALIIISILIAIVSVNELAF